MIKDNSFRSDEEAYVYWYFLELKNKGFVKSIEYEEDCFALGEDYYRSEVQLLKTKIKTVLRKLIGERHYTPDFTITWDDKARGLFFENIRDNVGGCYFISNLRDGKEQSIIEVKPHSKKPSQNTDTATRLRIAWTFHQHQIYVQWVVPVPSVKGVVKKVSPLDALFYATFTPIRYFTTDNSGKRRKINFEAKTLDEYIASRK